MDLLHSSPQAIGRSEVVTALGEALGDPGLQLVTGPTGVGKTTVAVAAARRTGRDVRMGGGLPSLAARPGIALARAIRVPLPPEPEDAVTLTVALVRDGILFLDDVHWADAHSVRVAVAAATSIRALLCVTDHGPDGEAPRGDGTDLVGVARSAARAVVRLGPLSDEDVAALVRRVDPFAPTAEVARVVTAAHGNPGAALAMVTGDSASARRALAVRARDLTVAGRTALVALGLAGRPTRARRLGSGAPELVEHGLAVEERPGDDPLLAFPSAATHAVAATLASPEALSRLHRHLAGTSPDPWDRVRHLAASGDTEGAVEAAVRAAPGQAPAGRARLLARAAELARGERRRRLWHAAADAADAAGDAGAAAAARRRAVTAKLTEREVEVMSLVAEGRTTAAIARRLQISTGTVETHVRSAVAKLGGRNRTEAAVLLVTGELP
ncbi:LuxR C-terminal-related transcriptional regulator [Geodermatophilus sp. SYSU D01180]